jgi:hypothetical protein
MDSDTASDASDGIEIDTNTGTSIDIDTESDTIRLKKTGQKRH